MQGLHDVVLLTCIRLSLLDCMEVISTKPSVAVAISNVIFAARAACPQRPKVHSILTHRQAMHTFSLRQPVLHMRSMDCITRLCLGDIGREVDPTQPGTFRLLPASASAVSGAFCWSGSSARWLLRHLLQRQLAFEEETCSASQGLAAGGASHHGACCRAPVTHVWGRSWPLMAEWSSWN